MRRALGLLYGALGYVVSLGAFLYAVGFVGNFGVPKSIDSGKPGPVVPSLLINALLLGIFALQHSVMAREGFKRWWTRFVPRQIERSTYVLFSSLALIFLYRQWQPLPDVIWSVESAGGRAVAQALFALGWLTVLLASLMIQHLDLLGVRQVWLRFQDLPYRDLGFRTPGLYRYVRHPIQAGLLIAFWATPTMTVGHLVFALGMTAYVVIAVKRFEERDLRKEFGPRYENYMRQVGGFLPKGRYREASPSR